MGQGLLFIEASWSQSIGYTPIGRTPLDEWSARHRDLYLTTHSTHNRQTSMPTAGFEPAIPASERPQKCGKINQELLQRAKVWKFLWRTVWVSAPHIHFTTFVNFLCAACYRYFCATIHSFFSACRFSDFYYGGGDKCFTYLLTRIFDLLKCVNKKYVYGKLNVEYVSSM